MKGVRLTLAIAALAFITALSASVSTQSRGTLSAEGIVRTQSGEPLANAVVSIVFNGGWIQARTDNNGRWTAAGLAAGEYKAMVFASGHASQNLKLQVKDPGPNQHVTVLLKQAGD